MAEEKINIATLEIDVKDFVKSATVAKKELEELREVNRDLRKVGKQGSQQFVQNDIRIKELSKTYRQQTQAATALNNATKDLTEATKFEGKSVVEVTNQRNNFIKLSKQIKGDTEGEIAQREKLNSIIDKQTDFIRENSSSYADNKDRIGEYRDAIQGSIIGNTKLGAVLTGGTQILEELNKRFGTAKAQTDSQTVSTTTLTGAQKAQTVATTASAKALRILKIALVASGIGAIVILVGSLVAGFQLMTKTLSRTEKGQAKLNKITSVFSGILNGLFKILEPLANFIFDVVVESFEALTEVAEKAFAAVSAGLSVLGFEDASNSVKNFTSEIRESTKAAQELADAEAKLAETQREQERTQLRFQRQAEKLRQIRDDEALSIEKRKKANEELGDVLSQQQQEELELANQALKVANLRIKAEGENSIALDERSEALTKIEEIEERIEGQRSEQLTNLNSLRREQEQQEQEQAAARLARQNEAFEARQQQQQEELELFIAQSENKNQTLQQELATAKEISNRKKAILQAELEAGKISELAYQAELLNIKKEFADKQSGVAVQVAEREFERQQQNIEREVVNTREKNNRLTAVEREFQLQRLQAGEISEQEYNSAINAINEENRIANKEAEAERQAINRENRIASMQMDFQQEFLVKQQQLERERQLEIANAEKTGADKTLINKKYNKFQADLDGQLQAQKVDIAKAGLNALSQIVDKQSAAGKAVAIAQSLINTQQGVTAALASAPPPFNFVLAGLTAAAGAKAIADIVSTKPPSVPKAARGMSIGGRPHSQGGTMIEAERGEAIVNKKAMASPLGGVVSAINQSFGGVPLASRGSNGSSFGSSSKLENSLINYNQLGKTFESAVRKIPPNQLALTEFKKADEDFVEIQERATI